jgi:vacuolar-type H+-ATPase subunit H
MCQRLADYETYIKNECKSPLLQKEKVQVDREELLNLLADLLAFHSADLHLEETTELDLTTVQMTKEQILKNAAWQARQMIGEAEVVRTSTLEEAVADAKKQAEAILNEAKAYDAKVKAEAEEIVSMTLTERRQELEAARKELEDSRAGILSEARQEGESILEGVRQQAEELRKELDAEIDLYRQAREAEMKESLKEAQQIAQATLEAKTRDALQLYADTLHKTEEMVNLVTALYEQQMEVIQQDRKDITAIVDKLERQGLQRSKR